VDLALGRPPSAGSPALSPGEEGALLFAIDRAGGDWIAAGGARFRVRGVLACSGQAADYLGRPPAWQLSGELECGDLRGSIWIWSLAPTGAPPRVQPPLASDRDRDWPVSLCIVAGRSAVDARQLEGLAERDVLTLDQCCHPLVREGRGEPHVRSGKVERRARWLDRRRLELVSTAERRPEMQGRPDGERGVTARLEGPLDAEAGALEVCVQVEVGRVTVSLEQALGLLRGAVLELDRDVGPAVQLRAGDKLIARGELVDCEGKLAVEITEVP
jgi:flagellar motor switch/type III secretory pathway protein FliN